ncbi:hypothetical protein KVR01_012967 [Diaporthe batatas]|uniref:uncharacterized protein n=1 Tax=Diaporthe batatas TaxID=748121 RepID=UPI001D03C95B|nr:uncharacterized protein KVR01_012967 [Diaporthe batatas]KAG8157259.1 hypothetical protein KVR01_012967 [Diaporthe batatas]
MTDSSEALVNKLWGDDEFADATIVMGQKTWRVHRAIICNQSQYFAKALEGHFMEAKSKTINLMSCDFLEEEVDSLLKYLYRRQLDENQKRQPLRAFVVADYFQVKELRNKAAEEASRALRKLIINKRFINYKEMCRTVLGSYPDTLLEEVIIKVIADNIEVVMYERDAAWDELTAAYPSLAKKVLPVLFPQPPPPPPAPLAGIKRFASVAFDDYMRLLPPVSPNTPAAPLTPLGRPAPVVRRRH